MIKRLPLGEMKLGVIPSPWTNFILTPNLLVRFEERWRTVRLGPISKAMSTPTQRDSLLLFFVAQVARIKAALYPTTTAHSPGPKRPDLADQEDK